MDSSSASKASTKRTTNPLDRLIVWVGFNAGNSEVLENIKNSLNLAFCSDEESPAVPSLNYNWQFECFKSPKEAQDYIAGVAVPSLLLLDPDEQHSPATSSNWDDLCRGLRALDNQACILTLITEDVPSGDTAVGWMDRGSNGLFNPRQSPEHCFTLLRELLTLPLKNLRPRDARIDTRHQVEMKIASIEQAIATETMNLGTGGLFIRSVPKEAEVGDLVEFTLKFDENVSIPDDGREEDPHVLKMDDRASSDSSTTAENIKGQGRIAWIRKARSEDLPEGIGVQFTLLSADDFKRIQEFVARRRVKAFIPKS